MSKPTPEGWRPSNLGKELESIEGGGTPSKKEPSYWDGVIPWATVKDITNSTSQDTQDHISQEGLQNSASRLVPARTILMATRMAVGDLKRFDVPVAINQDLKALTPRDSLDKNYLFHWLAGRKDDLLAVSGGEHSQRRISC